MYESIKIFNMLSLIAKEDLATSLNLKRTHTKVIEI